MRKVSATEFRTKIGKYLDSASERPLEIERKEKVTHVVVSVDRYRQMMACLDLAKFNRVN